MQFLKEVALCPARPIDFKKERSGDEIGLRKGISYNNKCRALLKS